jgi:diguanylate cyclase (GGDEF)-like protein
MRPPEVPVDEERRQAAVDEVMLTHPELERAFELATHVIASRLKVPVSTFTLVDGDRLYFVAHQGIDIEEIPRDSGFCGHAILQETLFVVSDALCHDDFKDNPEVKDGLRMRFYAGLPVHAPTGERIGTLTIVDTKPRTMTAKMRETLFDLRGIVESLVRLLSLSARDHLTGLPNRRYFDEIMAREWHRACRTRLPIALLAIDLDDFKAYNDAYGHQSGDECLRKIADTLRNVCKRSGDIPFRVGGEEFAVLLAMTSDESGALRFTEELHQEIHALAIPHKDSPFKIVSASIGIAVAGAHALPQDGSNLDEFIETSDAALYEAKAAGRNTTIKKKFG